MFYNKFALNCLLSVLFIFAASQSLNAQVTGDEFKPSGKVWGYAFTDFYVKTGGDTATWTSRAEYSSVAKDVYAFGMRRMYLGYDYNISPKISTVALLEGSDLITTSRGERGLTIKALNLRWKNIYNRADLLFGLIPTITFGLSEKVWAYRSIEKTIVDQRGIRSSSDMGISLHGRFDSLGNYGYNLMIGNGSGTRPEEITEAGKLKVFYADLYAYFFDRKIVLDLYGDYQSGFNERNFILLKAFLGYQSDPFTFGVEVLSQTQNNVKSDGTNASPFGISVFAHGVLIKDKLNAFARFDTFDPDRDYRSEDALQTFSLSNMHRHYDEQFFVAGLDFAPHKNVHIMPNIWINSYSPKAENNVLVERKADVVPRVTVFFSYR